MNYTLPETLEVCGTEYQIRWDYRAALDILAALESNELTNEEKAIASLTILYPSFDDMPREHYEEALKQCFWFIDGGTSEQASVKSPRLVHWEKDFPYIIAPINRIVGSDVRGKELHWWSFLAAYMEIGDCTFAQIVRIRDLKARGKPLDKPDKEWYRRNRHLVDVQREYTAEQKKFFENW